MSYVEVAKGLFRFIDASPTCYHAIKNVTEKMKQAGFQKLDEKENYENIGKDIISKGDFKGKIKNENVNDVLGFENDFKNAEVVITVDFEAKIQALNISAKTGQNREVFIKNSFSYDKQRVVLPS